MTEAGRPAKQSDRDVWRVGVLFSRTGLMAVSESEHFFGTALAIQEINNAGGILGREVEVVAYDPGSSPETYRKMADRLLTEDGASVIFGCSTSAERKAVLPAIERRNGLLWYPSLYEGFEYSPNVIYTGAAPNQNSFPLAEYIVRKFGPRVYLIGSDYIYPRESNRIMRDLVESYAGQVAGEQYVAMEAGDAELTRALDLIRMRSPDVVFSTIVGRTAQRFYRLFSKMGFDAERLPIASLTMAEGEIREIGFGLRHRCGGHPERIENLTTQHGCHVAVAGARQDVAQPHVADIRIGEAASRLEQQPVGAGAGQEFLAAPWRRRGANGSMVFGEAAIVRQPAGVGERRAQRDFRRHRMLRQKAAERVLQAKPAGRDQTKQGCRHDGLAEAVEQHAAVACEGRRKT